MPQNTPTGRTTRSGSGAASVTLLDIKKLIEDSKNEIVNTFKEEIERLNALTTSLVKRVDDLETKFCHLKEKCEIPTDKALITAESLDAISTEIALRNKKRDYLIVSGIAEASFKSVEERKAKDTAEVEKVAVSLGIYDIDVEEVIRLGRANSDRPRLIRFKCEDQNQRMEFLSKAKQLRSSQEFSRVFISPDLTKLQLQKSKALRDELKRRQEAGERVIIRRGRIINKDHTGKEEDFQN